MLNDELKCQAAETRKKICFEKIPLPKLKCRGVATKTLQGDQTKIWTISSNKIFYLQKFYFSLSAIKHKLNEYF